MDVERRRQEFRLEHVAKLTELASCPLQRFFLRHQVDALHFRVLRDVVRGKRDLLDRRLLGDEGADLDPLLDLFQRVTNVHDDEPEEADREERKGDRRYAQRAQQRRAAKGEEGVANGWHSRYSAK